MADAAVEFLLSSLKDLLIYHSDLITGTKNNIEKLDVDIRIFNAFLKESHKKRRKDEETKALVRNIRDVVYEVEGVIDAFVTRALDKKLNSSFLNFWTPSLDLHGIGKKVEDIKEKVEGARKDYANRNVINEDNYEKPKIRPPRHKDVVGFEDVTSELIKRLTKETNYFDVVGLTGMFGLGKTTLAWKIFNDQAIFYEFPVRIWLPVSQAFSKKDIFISILENLTTVTDDIRKKDDNVLAQMVTSHLQKGSFLIVFDDVWNAVDWDIIRDALPTDNYKGKVLITSRNTDVGMHACKPRSHDELRFFKENESWELLQLEALGTPNCPRELVATGKVIANECRGLPLAVVIIGGILSTKYWESDLGRTIKSWTKVSKKVSSYFKEDTKERMDDFISLSYDKLPYHLQACFLYLGMFPEDCEIPASKLIRMWIAEGFIQKSNESSLEETGEKYLEDLINRNLVRVEKFKSDGKIKTCRIHDALRDFCKTQAESEYENFLQEIKLVDGLFSPPINDIKKFRRLCVHSGCSKFISSDLFGPHVRSFISISKEEFTLSSGNVPSIPKAFTLLRVFDAKPLRFPKLCLELFQLVHVRYIVLSIDMSTLPAKFSKLWNLQTLIVNTTQRELQVDVNILNLIQLRLFKTNVSATLSKKCKDSKHVSELQTLGTISVESCTPELFQKACNLKKLGIRGKLSLLLEGKKGLFDSLGSMKFLENLKLINDVYPLPPSDGKLNGFPQPYQFPNRLKSLTLSATFLEWSYMYNLGLLPTLEVLKLKANAFIGKTWEVKKDGFPLLEFLLIDDTDLGVWTASSHHYPQLKQLVLRNCASLTDVPIELAEISTFKTFELNTCQSAANSARKVEAAKKESGAAFKLTVFPPDQS